MRHGRAKAARKTLRYFERTVNLKSKPYYSVLLDATFLIAMIRIASNEIDRSDGRNEGVAKSESTIVSRIERVLQVNGGGGSSFSGHTRDERLSGVVGGYDNNSSNDKYDNNNHGSGHRFIRYSVRYYVPREAVDEIETILRSFRDRSEKTKKQKKQRKYQEKSKVFEDALAWIKKNSSKKHSHKNSGRCEVLPRLEALVEPPNKKQRQETESKNDDDDNETDEEEATISASDAVRRHIARDDGREDPETNQNTTKKQQQQQDAFTRTYIVASQEEDLLDDLRLLGTIPILRCTNNASVLILENPSKKGQRTDKGKEQSKWKGALSNLAERALVDAAWEAQKKVKITGADPEANKRGQNTRAKGPNPLSCKRKRANGSQQQQGGSGESKSKKRRDRTQRNKSAESPAAPAASPDE